MKVNVQYLVPFIVSLAVAAGAQGNLNGSFSVQEDSSLTGSYSGSSLTLDSSNYTEPFIPATGTFATNVPEGTEVYAYSTQISGLSSTLESEPISNFLVIGGPGPALFGSPGTSPINRFDFNLQTLEEPTSGSFVGFGTLVDSTGAYTDTSAEFQLNFSGGSNYSFEIMTVPEPGALSMAMAGFAGLGAWLFLRRKSREMKPSAVRVVARPRALRRPRRRD